PSRRYTWAADECIGAVFDSWRVDRRLRGGTRAQTHRCGTVPNVRAHAAREHKNMARSPPPPHRVATQGGRMNDDAAGTGVRSIGQVGLYVDDLDGAARFYGEVLGMPELMRLPGIVFL